MMIFQGTWVLMGAGGGIGAVGVECLPLLTKLLLCVLQTTNFFLLLVNLSCCILALASLVFRIWP